MLKNCQINNFQFTSQIGSGAYGVVFKAVDITSDKVYAIKAVIKASSFNPVNSISATGNIKKSNVLLTQLYHYFKTFQNKLFLPTTDLVSIQNLSQEQLQTSIPHYREIALHLKVQQHENIVTIHQVLESPLATFIVMDYYPTDLFTSIVENQHFNSDGLLVKKVYLQLCSALQYCHQRGVYHCDIKPENILLDNEDNIHLCDFGLATTADHLARNVYVGSSYYMAPERVLCSNPNDIFPTATGDIWSIGIILINLTCIRNPWSKAHQNEDKTFHYFMQDAAVLQKILPISDELFTLLSNVLKINPYERIDLTSLMYEVGRLTSLTKDGWLSNVPALTYEQCDAYICGSNDPLIQSFLEPKLKKSSSNSSIIIPLEYVLDGSSTISNDVQFYPPQVPNGSLDQNTSEERSLNNDSAGLQASFDSTSYNLDDDLMVKAQVGWESHPSYRAFPNSLQYLQMNLPTASDQSDIYR